MSDQFRSSLLAIVIFFPPFFQNVKRQIYFIFGNYLFFEIFRKEITIINNNNNKKVIIQNNNKQ